VSRPASTGFWYGDEWRELRDPDGPPTGRQLLWLNTHGCIELVWPRHAEPITLGQASWAIDNARQEQAAADEAEA
jgi:hypothetical protein